MGRIRVLSEIVASQVAAGEVVERPSSVVKELVENSLDAGAKHLEVEVRGAGSTLLRITDDGVGMDREDALMALERHATNKIATAEDLISVRTMGFRGEAVPSIASVSEFTLRTKKHDEPVGTELIIHGGRLGVVRDAGCAGGTTIEVRNLFFNVPARKKFLRSAATETGHIDRVIETVALAFPHVAIHYLRDGKTVHRLPAAESLAVRVGDLFGAETKRELLEIPEMEVGGIRISGLVSRPGMTRADRSRQFYFVNDRAVESGLFTAGLRQAYRQMLETGRHPSIFLHLRMNPSLVDCNVHPAKREVRFRSGDAVRNAVSDAIETAMREARAEWLQPLRAHVAARLEPADIIEKPIAPGTHQPELPRPVIPQKQSPRGAEKEERLESVEKGKDIVETVEPHEVREAYRLIGELSGRYLLLEGGEGLVMLDQRAAYQRILFERLQRGVAAGAVASQWLLVPETVELGSKEYGIVIEHLETLKAAGFGIESFGAKTIKIEALPDFLSDREPRRVLEDFVADFLSGSDARLRGAAAEDAVRRAVARLTLDVHVAKDERSQRELVKELMNCELPYCDPEGRPVMLQFSWRDLDRKFGRN